MAESMYSKKNWNKEPREVMISIEFGIPTTNCPACDEMSYDADRCPFCGQALIYDNTIEHAPILSGAHVDEYGKIVCDNCGGSEIARLSHFEDERFHGYKFLCCECCADIVLSYYPPEEPAYPAEDWK